jgi:hypothetical protein
VAGRVGVDEVLGGRVPAGQGLLELGEAGGPVDGEQRGQVGRTHVAHPVDRGGLPGLGHDRPVDGEVHISVLVAAPRTGMVYRTTRIGRHLPSQKYWPGLVFSS